MAAHYARIFTKLDLQLPASALSLGYALTRQLTFQVPIWTCVSPPFQGKKYVGGFYRTLSGQIPTLTERGWQLSGELGAGHAVFVGLDAETASHAAAAARGNGKRLILSGSRCRMVCGPVSSPGFWMEVSRLRLPILFHRAW
jgi:hypothetical protein